ncbi:MAG: methylmalonyl Co-A mutase-associated GTPase MeaB [Acidimicrobiales bacterium]
MARLRSSDPAELVDVATRGDRAALARLLTIVEHGGDEAAADDRLIFAASGRAHTVGLTGSPGAGKSTLTNALISSARASGQRVGVLAIDPSSPFTGGAILGDRVRMGEHALDHDVFIRSMATRGHLGGLAVATPQAARVLDAVGFDLVLIETVGVGQVEVEVAGEADTTVVVVNPGWGDAVQANKAGLREIADLFVINKADRPGAAETRRDLEQMLGLSVPADDGWVPPIVDTVATTGDGVATLWGELERHRRHLRASGGLATRRATRLRTELDRVVAARLAERVGRIAAGERYEVLGDEVAARRLDPWSAADRLLAEAIDG